MANREVILEHRGALTLRTSDYITTGGEGSVYKKGDTVIKIYTDPKKMQNEGMPEKIRLLSRLAHEYIIEPKGLVMNKAGNPIGFYMAHAAGEPLSRVFTNDFRTREAFGDDDVLVLADRMRNVCIFAHGKNALLVDPNELNWLVALSKKDGPAPRAIDVDSWAIGKWKGTVIMPSIRDWHSRVFDQRTDWYAWGIVTFQLFTGIHPYKGKLDGYKPGEMERRMKENASVFRPDIRLNSAVRDFACIPNRLLNWYVATFERGERTIPPSPFDIAHIPTPAIQTLRAVVTGSGLLTYQKLLSGVGDPIIRIFTNGIVLSKSGKLLHLGTKREIGRTTSLDIEVVAVHGGYVKVEKNNGQFLFSFMNGVSLQEQPLSCPIQPHSIVWYEDRMFAVTEQGLSELVFRILGKPILSMGQTWGAMMNATRWYDGVGIQDAMGATYVIAPFEAASCAHIRVHELDGMKPINAKAGNRFIVIIAIDRSGRYHKIELTMDRVYKQYVFWKREKDSPELNTVILPKGVAAVIEEDGELNIYVPTNGALNKIKDKGIKTDRPLSRWGDIVTYIHDGDIWSIRVK